MKKEGFAAGGKQLKGGFTLVEVLIALTVIGIAAAITIPVVIHNIEKQRIVIQLKRTYSTLAQAAQQIIQEEGSPECSEGGWICPSGQHSNYYKYFKKHLNAVKDCPKGNLTEDCLPPAGDYHVDANMPDALKWSDKLILPDGTMLYFWNYWSGMNGCDTGVWFMNGEPAACTVIWADVNGKNIKPNRIAKDFFAFVIRRDGLHPAGCHGTNTNGFGEACKLLREMP